MSNLTKTAAGIDNDPSTKECSICLDIYHRPCKIVPCMHIYCDPCLRRLYHAGSTTCPQCRKEIEGCYFDTKLDKQIKKHGEKQYNARQQKEEQSDVFDLPLPGDIIDGIIEDSSARERKGYILIIIMLLSWSFSLFNLQAIMRQWIFQ